MAGALAAAAGGAGPGAAAEMAETVVDRGHADRVALLAVAMAGHLGWSPRAQARLHLAARLHDLGKAVVPETLLSRPGPLSVLETRHVGRHAEIGASLAAAVLDGEQAAWVRHHHERWDGAGLPDGLAGAAIPEGAQLLALADAWDAMTRPRPYRAALSQDDALAEVERCAGAQFRPDALELIRAALAFETAAAE
ncbi:MAG TPA: HD domain-containing phosphohydrolase, partial [Solirubrobacteraceae bacterium]|nr:HD domain-containing phosphohydrolase [Solirubrobacteraceae bacterium]